MTTDFAGQPRSYADGQTNVSTPPESILATGFVPETAYARGQGLPAQWLNWLFRSLFRAVNRDVVTDASGAGIFPVPDAMIRLEAFDRANPGAYLIAIGYMPADGAMHALTVVASQGLELGQATVTGTQPVVNGGDVMVVGYSRQMGGV
jgi:hypothetical protein